MNRWGKVRKNLREKNPRYFLHETIAKQDCETSDGKPGSHVLKSKDGGKTLGCHSSRKSAEAQEAAVHVNKEAMQHAQEALGPSVATDLAWEHINRIVQDLDQIETQELREDYLNIVLTRLNALLIEVEESGAPYN